MTHAVEPQPSADTLWSTLSEIGLAAGLAAIGSCDASVLQPARSVLPMRKEEGIAATMQFTYRNPARSSDPGHIFDAPRSIVVGAWSYHRRPLSSPPERSGRVASYAWRDHYAELEAALQEVAAELTRCGWIAKVHLDDNHLVDRNVAFRAGLGWYGKNANLLLPGQGSWFVLGSIVTNAVLPASAPPVADGCGPCTRCIDDCPTAAIVAPGVVDARRCLAWLVQGPGEIPLEFREAVGDRLYGCDDCQDVCPPNQRVAAGEPPAEADADAFVPIAWILTASDDELMARVGRWYIAERNPNVVRRTALVVAGNTADESDHELREIVTGYAVGPNELLAEHARWALGRIDGRLSESAPAS